MGALALVATFVVGLYVFKVKSSEVLDGFPASLFVILVGVTYLFALAKNNGTVDWIVHASVRAVGGRVALVPWAMFFVTAAVTSIGAVSPAAVAIIAPVALGFAATYRIHPVLMGMFVVQGATAGSFSPIGIFGSITNGVVLESKLEGNPLFLFVTAFGSCLLIVIATFFAFGGRALMARGRETDGLASLDAQAQAGTAALHADHGAGEPHSRCEAQAAVADAPIETGDTQRLNAERISTLVGLVFLIVGALAFDLDVGFVSLTIAIALTLAFPASAKGAVDKIAWSTILLIGGIVTYVGLLQEHGVVDWLGDGVAGVGGAAARGPAHLPHRRGRLGVRLDDRHHRRAHPARRALPPARGGERRRAHRGAGDLLLGRRLQPVLDERRPRRRQQRARGPRPRLPHPHDLGHVARRHRPAGRLGDPRRADRMTGGLGRSARQGDTSARSAREQGRMRA